MFDVLKFRAARLSRCSALVLAVVCVACSPPVEDPASSAAPAAQTVEKANNERLIDQMSKVSSLRWVRALGDLYPDEYRRLGDSLERIAQGPQDIVSARISLMSEVLPFMAERKASLRSATDETLVEYLRANLAVLEHLKVENPVACVEVAQGRLNPSSELSEAGWGLMSEVTRQLLVAARAAEERPFSRPSLSLSPEEQRDWLVQVGNAGATRRTGELLRDPGAAASASPEEMCQVRILLMKGALLSPPSTAAKIVLAAG